MKHKHVYLVSLLLLGLAGCSPLLSGRGGSDDHLKKAATQNLNSTSLRGSSWSVMAVDLANGRVLLSQDPQRILMPGSNMKLLTTACALEILGPEFRASTQVGYTGVLEPGGVIDGDLVVIGGGDPTLSTRFRVPEIRLTAADTAEVCAAWADTLYAKGVRQIRGGLVAYSGLFGGEALGSGWEWDDLPAWYAAELGPLVYMDNCIEVAMYPADSVGSPAQVAASPAGSYVTLAANVLTGAPTSEGELHYDRDLGSNIITIWGTVPQGSGLHKRWISVHDPAGFFLASLESALIQRGIMILRTPRVTSEARPESDFKVIFADPSPPLRDLIRYINTLSQSLYTEVLIRLLGTNSPNTTVSTAPLDAFEAGRERVLEWEKTINTPGTGFLMADASGLSRRNLISAQEIIKILVHMNRSPHRNDFLNSLAYPNVGTLERRFLGLPAGIGLRAKSGSLSRIRSLSGYLMENNQPRIVFSFICNNYFTSAGEVDQTMENLVQLLALYLKEE